ncbi:Ig-like domain-containing protein [Neobacillus vireti]|uniref:Ig-like domain-containing protein n=1 Tax=Neobacillus vireti TaxID=220686 RepID=UPI002FFFBF5D
MLAVLLALQLLLIPAGVLANTGGGNTGAAKSTQIEKMINAKIAENKQPKKSINIEADYTDPASYPLKNKGSLIDSLVDSKGSKQDFTYSDLTTSEIYGSDYMNLSLSYSSNQATQKDTSTTLEFFWEYAGYLYYLGSTDFDTTNYTSGSLNSHLAKSDFSDQPYIYVRLGVAPTYYDNYSDVTMFKVANPFYGGSGGENSGDDSYAVINNESLNPDATEPTGSFSVNNMKYTMDKNLKPEAYQMDYEKPYDVSANKDKKILKGQVVSKAYRVGDTKSFWVSNLETNASYQITAKLAYTGTKAEVWVYNNQITSTDAQKLGTEFDNKIYPSVTNNFGKESDVNGDGKISILCFDIQDGFSGSGGYVAGYFYGGDLFDDTTSNKSEIFYIDTYPLMGTGSTKDVTASYETLAHEFQHMVNFNQNIFIENSNNNMDAWLNEGLSMAAEQIYTGAGLESRVDYYNSSTSIQNGHSLLYWDYAGDTLSNYSLSYLFVQYVKLQAGQGDKIFREILTDPDNNYKAIEDVAKKYISPTMTFGKLMTDFRMALLLKQDTGLYGFKGDTFFDSVQTPTYTGSSTNLRGGGAVVTTFNSQDGFTIPASKGADITYKTFKMDGSGMDTTPPPAPVVSAVTDQSTAVTGTTEANASITVMAGTNTLGTGNADGSGKFTVTIAKQKGGTKLSVIARDSAGNESITTVTVATTSAYKQVKVQLNGKDFNAGYYGNGNTYVYWRALDTFKIPYTYKGNGVFSIEGRTVQAQTINGALYIAWNQLSPGKVTYVAITGGYNFIYAVPTKIQLNGKDFNTGYYKNGVTYVYWRALDTFKIPYTYKGNGVFSIEGRTVQAQTINGALYIAWNQLSPGKVTYMAISGGYNFIYTP